MPDKRPMPLSGDDGIEDDPVLGKPIANYPSRRLRALLIGWSFLIGVSLILNIGLWNVESDWVSTLVTGGIGTLALVIGWWIMGQWNREVILYEKGFSYREGSANVPFLYAEVAGLRIRAEQLAYFGGLIRRVIYRITLRMRSGDKVILDNTYNRVDKMGDLLTVHVMKAIRPFVEDRLAAGDAVPFADYLNISNEGIHVDSIVLENATEHARLTWDSFGGYRVENRQLLLITTDDAVWFGIPLAEIDNLVLLLELLRQKHPQEQTHYDL